VEAAKALMKAGDQKRAVSCLQQAVSLYTDMGRLGMAARQLKEIGEVLEREGSKEEAIMFYEQAWDLFATDNSSAEANRCALKVAQFSADLERYGRAIALYEDVARASVDNNLLKYSAKGYLMQAGLCVLVSIGPVALKEKLETYKDLDVAFDGSREAKLLDELAAASEEGDVDAFTTAVAEFDSLTRLDAWKTSMLLRAKRRLVAHEEAEEEDLT
jgi:alpha-soluble NSF attachment protein